MSDAHDGDRRSFLIKSAASIGAVATLPQAAVAQPAPDSRVVEPVGRAPVQRIAASPDAGEQGRTFFTEEEAYTVKAIAERIMPGAPGKAGATDADVINYIDLALSGAYADQQEFYRRGLIALDAHCQVKFQLPFMKLSPAQQDEALTACEAAKATSFDWPSSQQFFNVLRTHTMEGMFSDPAYGGNKDFAGWKLVGFPGAQRIYTSADLKSSTAYEGGIQGMQGAQSSPGGRN